MLTGPAGIVYKHFEKVTDPRANRGPTHNLYELFSVVAGQPQRIDEHRAKGSSRRSRMRQEARELLATV